jgi:hypothetical protein
MSRPGKTIDGNQPGVYFPKGRLLGSTAPGTADAWKGRPEMANRAWNHWVIASILAAALWAAGSSKAEEKAQPKAFDSTMAFSVYAVIGEWPELVGFTPFERPLTIPPCRWWFVEPLPPVDMEQVRQEVEAQRIPGLRLRDATDEDLEHLKGLRGLQYLGLWQTHVTDAGVEQLKKSLPNVRVTQ